VPEEPTSLALALARLYDLDLLDDPGDVDLYVAIAARTGGPILELACGSGRLAIPLASEGYDVTGVDLEPAMLARARAAADEAGPDVARHLRWVQADIRDLALPEAGSYRLAFIGLNSLFLLADRREQAAALATLARHLASGGLVVIDAWLPDAEDLARFDGRLMLEWVRVDPDTGHHVTKTGAALHDAANGVVRLTSLFDEGVPGGAPVRWIREDRLKLVGADDLRTMAEAADLVVETIAGTYDLDPLAPGSERAVLVARKP
jgi:SAM-dependent methyltransferase